MLTFTCNDIENLSQFTSNYLYYLEGGHVQINWIHKIDIIYYILYFLDGHNILYLFGCSLADK